MNEERLDHLAELARADFASGDPRRAKDRLRAVLRASPHFRPALELMGYIYFGECDHRNAVMYWSRADYWCDPMPHACERVLGAIGRALTQEKMRLARCYLYAFAGSSPPAELAGRISAAQSAYYKLDQKRLRRAGLMCAPLSGGCLIIVVSLVSIILGATWSSFAWLGAVAVATTLVVTGINTCSYLRASQAFHEAVAQFHRRGNNGLTIINR